MNLLHAWLMAVALTVPGDVELVEFTATWCAPCQTMEPLLDEARTRGYRVTEVDVDEQVEVARQYGIAQVPTIMIVSRGKVVDRLEGAAAIEKLWDHLARIDSASSSAAAARTAPRTGPASPSSVPLTNSVPTRSTSAISKEAAEKLAMEATVRLRVEDPSGHSFGSGTIVDVHDSEALVLTCGHIFRDSEGRGKIAVELCGIGHETPIAGELIRYDLDRDLALVAIHLPIPVKPVRVAGPQQVVDRGQPLFSIGCNRGAAPTILRGPLRTINQYLGPENLVMAGQPIDGRSGGGLFNYEGYLLGVCNAADPERQEGLYAAYPSIHKHLDEANLAFVYQAGNQLSNSVANAPDARQSFANVPSPSSRSALARSATIPPASTRSSDSKFDSVAPAAQAQFTRSSSTERSAPGGLAASEGVGMASRNSQARAVPANFSGATLPGIPDAARNAPPDNGLSPALAAIDPELAKIHAQGAEVICIVRPRMDPNAKSQVFVLERPSRMFLSQLQQEKSDQGNRQMTQLRVNKPRRLELDRTSRPNP